MSWFLIALAAPFLWALVNIADQYLVSKYSVGERGSGGLVLFSSFIGIFVALGIAIFHTGIFDISFKDKFLLIITGGLTISWIILYLWTLEIEDISAVAPWFLSVPVFGYILGYVFLGETINLPQKIGSIVVLVGLFILSVDFSKKEKKSFKLKPALYMVTACLMIAVMGIIFKYVTIEGNFWTSSFWEYGGLGIFGILIYLLVPRYRREFKHMNEKGGVKIFILNITSEIATMVGNFLTNYSLLLAPVVMVYFVGSFQPAIVLFLSIIGTKFFPKIIQEDISKKVLIPKILAIVIMTIGSFFLFF
jgi:drug/metabolite transporter (DMT)-like permease